MIVAKFGKILLAVGAEDGKANHSVAHHDGAVLHQHRVVDTHQESLLENKADMRVKFIESVIDVAFLPVLSVVKGDFFGMSEQITV